MFKGSLDPAKWARKRATPTCYRYRHAIALGAYFIVGLCAVIKKMSAGLKQRKFNETADNSHKQKDTAEKKAS